MELRFGKTGRDYLLRYWKNWCAAGGAILGGIGGIAAGIAGVIYASSSTPSCTKVYQSVEIRSKNSFSSTEWHLNVTGVTENIFMLPDSILP